MQSDSFLLIVTAAECVGSINGAEIYRINKVEAATLNVKHPLTLATSHLHSLTKMVHRYGQEDSVQRLLFFSQL